MKVPMIPFFGQKAEIIDKRTITTKEKGNPGLVLKFRFLNMTHEVVLFDREMDMFRDLDGSIEIHGSIKGLPGGVSISIDGAVQL